MAKSYVDYPGNSSTTSWTVTFQFLSRDDVSVFDVSDDSPIAFTWLSDSLISISPAVSSGTTFRIKRTTNTDSRVVDFQNATVLDEAQLDASADQNFFIAQEINDDSEDKMALVADGTFDARSKRISDLADPVNPQDAVTLSHFVAVGDVYAATAAQNVIDTETARDDAETAQVAAEAAQLDSETARDEAEVAQAAAEVAQAAAEATLDHNHDADYEPIDTAILRGDTTSNVTVGFTTDIEVLASDTITPNMALETLKTRSVTGNVTINVPTGGNGVCEILLTIDGTDRTITAGTNVKAIGVVPLLAASAVYSLVVTRYSATNATMQIQEAV